MRCIFFSSPVFCFVALLFWRFRVFGFLLYLFSCDISIFHAFPFSSLDLRFGIFISCSPACLVHPFRSCTVRPCMNQIELSPYYVRKDLVDFCKVCWVLIGVSFPLLSQSFSCAAYAIPCRPLRIMAFLFILSASMRWQFSCIAFWKPFFNFFSGLFLPFSLRLPS
mgnify:CR=1 FL=1